MGELSSSLPDELNFLLRGRAPGKRQVKPVSIEKAEASLAWVKNICGDDDDDDDEEEFGEVNDAVADEEIGEEEASSNEDGDEDNPDDQDNDNDSPAPAGENMEEPKPLKLVVKRAVQISDAGDEADKAAVPAGLGFLLKSRAPGKRKVKPVSADKAAVLAEFGGSDDDDLDFQIGEEPKDDDNSHSDSTDDDDDSDSDSSYSPDKKKKKKTKTEEVSSADSDVEITKEERIPVHIDLDALENESSISSKAVQEVLTINGGPKVETLVCLVCLKENNDDKDNELVQCDGCGIACHVLCYGIGECSDDGEEHDGGSTPLSTASTEPWFCDVCRAGITKPICQLCPNEGGAFKPTDSGQWVHLICALYTGCSFGEVGGLSRVNVNAIKQKLWGARVCTLCQDSQCASTGVCISCDAGMCRMVFHVTCAQREGLLADAPVAVAQSVLTSSMQSPLVKLPRAHRNDYSSDEEKKKHRQKTQEVADPFYACCKRHSNPESTKRNKRNCLAAFRICNTFQQEDRWELAIGRDRYERKLFGAREKFLSRTRKQMRAFEASSTFSLCYQSRPVTSCPAFVKRALQKAKLGGVEEEHFVMSPSFNNSAAVSASHYSPLSFTARFIQYFEARNRRIDELRSQHVSNDSQQKESAHEEAELKKTYEVLFQTVRRHRDQGDRHCSEVAEIHSCVADLLNKYFKTEQDSSDFVFTVPPLPSELTATTDRKQFENELKETAGVTIYECNVCKQTRDQHMLMQCGTCKRQFHCFCLDPPLSQPWTQKISRRSTAKWAWECHFCCPSSSDGDVVRTDVNVNAPRQLRREIKAPVRFIVSSEDSDQTKESSLKSQQQSTASTSKETEKEEKANGRNVCYTHKGGRGRGRGRGGGRKRSRGGGAEAQSSESPAKKQGKQSPVKVASPPKLVIPSISTAALNKSPTKPPDPAVYDFSSDSNE